MPKQELSNTFEGCIENREAGCTVSRNQGKQIPLAVERLAKSQSVTRISDGWDDTVNEGITKVEKLHPVHCNARNRCAC
jgi:hypothetical protein